MSAPADCAGAGRRLADLAMLGHELRNPLAAALTGVAAAAAMTDAADPRAALLGRAAHDLERLAGLLTAYLELLGGRPVRTVPLDLAATVRAVAARRGAAVTVAVEAPDVPVRGSPALLERALENLVDNALRSGARRVEISAARRGGEVVLEVADDGPGVPEGVRDRLFDAFVSGRGSSGLGLALVHDIAAAHGGSVRLLPSRQGARFVLSLPAVAPPAGLAVPAAVLAVPAAGTLAGAAP
jgi:signal transduction histidine kinase